MKKILMVGDAGCRTGFARVLKGVADHLHSTGQWEVVVRAINYQQDHDLDYTYDVQPITYGGDASGASMLPYHVDELKPDVIWALHDPWVLAGYGMEKPPEIPSVCYVPVDTPGMKWEFGLGLAAWSEAVAYTQFGASELAASVQDSIDLIVEEADANGLSRDSLRSWLTLPARQGSRNLRVRVDRLARLQNPSEWNILPHALEPGVFEPRDKQQSRVQFGLPADAFIVGMVGVNSGRKRIDAAIRCFAQFATNTPNSLFVIHCYAGDDDGFDIASLARFYGVSDKVAAIHWQYPLLSDDDLCTLYNGFDVLLNTSGGEGWGLTAFEAAACGVPQVVPDWAAPRELWQDHGLLIEIESWRHVSGFLNTVHASIDTAHAAGLLHLLNRQPEHRFWSERALARAAATSTWVDVGQGFEGVIENAILGSVVTPMSIADLLFARKEPIRSEVL